MQFLVMMRDGSRYRIEAAYIEVVNAEESSYTLLGPVPGYASAILATFPASLVTAVLPYSQVDGYVPARRGPAQREVGAGGPNGRQGPARPEAVGNRPPLGEGRPEAQLPGAQRPDQQAHALRQEPQRLEA